MKALNKEELQHYREVVGQHVAKARKEQGLSQAELAERVGCSRLTIRKVENGSGQYSIDIATQLCALLGIAVRVDGQTILIHPSRERYTVLEFGMAAGKTMLLKNMRQSKNSK
jgi:DNA-binding XRE family transcriptional regulator